jgi:hypothetical protein
MLEKLRMESLIQTELPTFHWYILRSISLSDVMYVLPHLKKLHITGASDLWMNYQNLLMNDASIGHAATIALPSLCIRFGTQAQLWSVWPMVIEE